MLEFIRNLFKTRNWYPLSRVPEGFFSPPRTPGAVTCAEQALTLAPFWAAVRLYSTQVGSFPLVTYRRTQDGGREKADTNPAAYLLSTRPNPAQSRPVFWQFVVKELFLYGNAYIVIRWKGNNTPHALYPIPCGAVESVMVDDEWNKAYKIRLSQTAEVYPDTDVIHLMAYSRDGIQGEPLYRYAGEALGLHRQVLESANAFFSNAARPSLYVKYPGKLDKQAIENLKGQMKEAHQGTANTGTPLILSDNGEFTQTSTTTAEDMQLSAALGASVGDVGRWTGLSPIQLGDFSAAHYSTLEADNAYFYQRSIRPVLDQIEAEVNHKLFADGPTFAEFDVDEVLRGDPTSTAALANVGIQGGWLLRSEAREWFGLPPVAGLDTPLAPINLGGNPATSATSPTSSATTSTQGGEDASAAQQTAV